MFHHGVASLLFRWRKHRRNPHTFPYNLNLCKTRPEATELGLPVSTGRCYLSCFHAHFSKIKRIMGVDNSVLGWVKLWNCLIWNSHLFSERFFIHHETNPKKWLIQWHQCKWRTNMSRKSCEDYSTCDLCQVILTMESVQHWTFVKTQPATAQKVLDSQLHSNTNVSILCFIIVHAAQTICTAVNKDWVTFLVLQGYQVHFTEKHTLVIWSHMLASC